MKTENNAIEALVKKCKELKHHAMLTTKETKTMNRVDET
jgi:hypothetical protein